MKKLTLDEFKRRMIEQRRRQHEEPPNVPQPVVEHPEPVVEQVPEEPAANEEPVIEVPEPAPVAESVEIRAKSAPASRSTSPLVVLEPERKLNVTQEAPAVLSSEPTWKRFEQYTSPLASLRRLVTVIRVYVVQAVCFTFVPATHRKHFAPLE